MVRSRLPLEAYQAKKVLIIKLEGIQHFIGNYLADLEDKEVESRRSETQKKKKINLWNRKKLI